MNVRRGRFHRAFIRSLFRCASPRASASIQRPASAAMPAEATASAATSAALPAPSSSQPASGMSAKRPKAKKLACRP